MSVSFKVGSAVVLITCFIGLTEGFIPTSARRTAANGVFFHWGQAIRDIISLLPGFNLDRESVIHPDMTREAILQTVADIFINNPNPKYASSVQDVQQLVNSNKLDSLKLIKAYHGDERGNEYLKRRAKKLNEIIDDIGKHNGNVDIYELKKTEAHFDSEQFKAGQNRLIKFRRMATMLIKKTDPDYDNARKFTGRLLHTLQDFYSHTNWIENWVGEADPIIPYRVLGEMNKVIETVSKLDNPCTDCRKVGFIEDLSLKSPYLTILSPIEYVQSSSIYACEDNLHSSLKSQKLLTSGYSHDGEDTDGNVIVKTNGKCSHGGIIDGSQDKSAKGGINKDSTHPELASHYKYHKQAAAVAQQHSYELLSSMRNDVNNDLMFGTFLGIEIAASVGIVIDTTLKTSEDLMEIQTMTLKASGNIQQYMPDTPVRYILVPLNTDVGQLIITDDVNKFTKSIAQLSVQNTGGGSVPVMDAIVSAAKASYPNSIILVFTDSSASDIELLGNAEAIVSEKNLKVLFIGGISPTVKRSLDIKEIHKDKIRHRRQDTDDVYKELEMFSDGQIIDIPSNEISELASLVTFSVLSITIFRRAGSAGRAEYSFPVDSYTSQILIFVNGQNLNVSVVTPQGVNPDSIPQYSSPVNSTTSYIATINITEDTLFGQWRIIIESAGIFTVQIMGSTELIISTQIFTSSPDGVENIGNPKPLQSFVMFVEATILGSENPILISSINATNDQGSILSFSNLTEIKNNKYTGFLGNLPSEEFQLQVNGIDDNGFPFSYISDISVEPTAISLTFGENEVGYVMLQPGEKVTISISLLNTGNDDTFRIKIDTDASDEEAEAFNYVITPSIVTVKENMKADISVDIFLYYNAPIGFSATFTLVAQSVDDIDASDYIIFDVTNKQINPTDSSAELLLPNNEVMVILSTVILLFCNLY